MYRRVYEEFQINNTDLRSESLLIQVKYALYCIFSMKISLVKLRMILDELFTDDTINVTWDKFIVLINFFKTDEKFQWEDCFQSDNLFKILDSRDLGYFTFEQFQEAIESNDKISLSKNDLKQLFINADEYGIGKITALQFKRLANQL